MDSTTFVAMAAICAPLVHPATAQALVSVESAFNPHAIGVVGGALRRQPATPGEALATAQALANTGWNFSVGLAQINVRNLPRFGLTLQEAFDPCKSLQTMQAILGECFDRVSSGAPAQQRLRRALSCYYSGNFVTGFRHGYVERVVKAALSTPVLPRAPP